jgi:hypothetical protein
MAHVEDPGGRWVPAWVLTWRNSRTAQGANGSLASWSLGCWKKLKWCDSGALWYWKMNTMNDNQRTWMLLYLNMKNILNMLKAKWMDVGFSKPKLFGAMHRPKEGVELDPDSQDRFDDTQLAGRWKLGFLSTSVKIKTIGLLGTCFNNMLFCIYIYIQKGTLSGPHFSTFLEMQCFCYIMFNPLCSYTCDGIARDPHRLSDFLRGCQRMSRESWRSPGKRKEEKQT